jgi:hypothetical protein
MPAVEIKGLNQAKRQLEVTATELSPGLERTLGQIAEAARGHMQANYLSGSPLRVRTGKLRSNWQVRRFRRENQIEARVATNTVYARVHNDGFNGVQQVRAHSRRGRPVRSHSRFMRIKAKRYVEGTLRDIMPLAKKLLDRFQRGLMDGKAKT